MSVQSVALELEDRWVLPLKGNAASRCMVDAAFHLQFLERPDPVTITIESAFSLAERGVRRTLTPADPSTLGPALALLNRSVFEAIAFKNGTLRIELDGQIILTVNPDPLHEAWGLVSDARLRFVCLPGGSLAVWT